MKKRKDTFGKTFIMNIRNLACFLLVFCMTFIFVPVTSFAEETEDPVNASAGEHVLNEANNWDISKEFIMPGESFRIEPKYNVQHEKLTAGAEEVGARVTLSNAALFLNKPGSDTEGQVTWYDSKLVRSEAETSKIVPGPRNTYNVIKMAYDKGDLKNALSYIQDDDNTNQAALQAALGDQATKSVNAGYVNNTNTPIVLEQVRGSSTEEEGKIYGGEYGMTLLVDACSTQRWGCTIRFYEPYYTLTYNNLREGEEEGLPDRYYVKNGQQEIVLPNLVRPGYHFKEWVGNLSFAEKTDDGEKTVYSFDGNDLLNAGYNWGDETLYPSFEYGYTVTFNTNGGTINGKENQTFEFSKDGETFFDIGNYVPEREGYNFLGWCYKPSADSDSLIEDTSNYNWVDKATDSTGSGGYDKQLYAKWQEKKAIELIEINGVTTDFKAGNKPVFTAKAPENAPYYIDYESWSGSDEFVVFSSDYWNNAYVERGWCKGLISEFKEKTSYNYGLYIKLTQAGADAGYYFDKEKTKLSINGQIRNLSSDMIGIESAPYDDTATFGSILTINPVKPDPCANGHTSKKEVTQATVKGDGQSVTKCSVCSKTLSTEVIPKASDIRLSATSYTYNGKVRKPSVTVKDRAGNKISTANYTVSYAKGLKNVGSYVVTIKFKGNYSGTVKKTFTINPKSTSISGLAAGKKKFTVKWKKQATQTTGYQIQYSTSSKFKSAKTVTVSKNTTTSKVISKLKAKKKYYVRIRTYKTVSGKKYFSGWSSAKSVKTKK